MTTNRPCRQCGSPLISIDSREGKEALACPLAVSERRPRGRGEANKVKSHKECLVYEKSERQLWGRA